MSRRRISHSQLGFASLVRIFFGTCELRAYEYYCSLGPGTKVAVDRTRRRARSGGFRGKERLILLHRCRAVQRGTSLGSISWGLMLHFQSTDGNKQLLRFLHGFCLSSPGSSVPEISILGRYMTCLGRVLHRRCGPGARCVWDVRGQQSRGEACGVHGWKTTSRL
jgi:hypothetical protein